MIVPILRAKFGANASAYRVAAGLAIVVVGAPLAWIVRDVVHGGLSPVYSALLLVAGIAILMNYTQIFRRKTLYVSATEFGITVFPILAMTVLATAPLSQGSIRPTDLRQMIDNAVLFFLLVAGFSQPVEQFRSIHRGIALLGVVVASASLLYAISSIGNLTDFISKGRFGGFGEETGSGAPGTIARIGLITIVAAWFWYREEKEARLVPSTIILVAGLSALPMFLLARSRTNMLGAAILLAAAIAIKAIRWRFYRRQYTEYRRARRFRMTRFKLALALVAIIALFISSEFLIDKFLPLVNLAFAFFSRGVESLLGGGSTSYLVFDASAATRRQYVAQVLETFNLWGHGFGVMFADDPVLQAFYDLGLVGGTIYVLIVLIVPLKVCLDLALTQTPAFVKFSMACYFLQVPFLFLSVTPYILNNWSFVMLFYIVVGRYWSTRQPDSTSHLASSG